MKCKKYDIEIGLKNSQKEWNGDFLKTLEDSLGKILNSRQKLMKSYLLSYPLLVKHFSKIGEIGIDEFVLGVYMIYGWMPRALCFNEGKPLSQKEFDALRTKLLALKKCDEDHWGEVLKTDAEDLFLLLQRVTNGSIVGMSKLLHFVHPKVFPIYDSNIAEVLGEVKNVEDYIEYVKVFHAFRLKIENGDGNEKFKEICVSFKEDCIDKFGSQGEFSVTPVRAIELCMFQIGKSIKDFKKKSKKEARA